MPKYLALDMQTARSTDLSWPDKACFMAIKYFQGRNEECWPSYSSIGKLVGLSRSQVRRSIDKLVELNYVRRRRRLTGEREWHSNFYSVVKDRGVPLVSTGMSVVSIAPVPLVSTRTIQGVKRVAEHRKVTPGRA